MNNSFWIHLQVNANIFSINLLLSISIPYMSYHLLDLQYCFVYQAYIYIDYSFKVSKATKQYQWSIIILMMIQHIPCKWTLVCHVVVKNNLYLRYASVLLDCINAVMTRVVCRPFILIETFDPHGPLHVMFVVKIIGLPLSGFLWCM